MEEQVLLDENDDAAANVRDIGSECAQVAEQRSQGSGKGKMSHGWIPGSNKVNRMRQDKIWYFSANGSETSSILLKDPERVRG